VVGQVQKGLTVSNTTPVAFQQCVSVSCGAAGTITFAKGFAASFKVRNVATTPTTPNALAPEDIPGAIYETTTGGLTETGFYNPNLMPSGAQNAGLADYGTRLRIVFAGLQAGVTVYVANNVAYCDGTGGCTAGTTVVNGGAPVNNGLYAQLTASEGGPFTAVPANGPDCNPGYSSITMTSAGAGEAIYEVLAVKSQILLENLAIPFIISYTANPGANSPALGTATVGGSFAPVSTDTNASASDTIPRFADTSVATNAFTINKCATHLLFPFVTNQAGYDTGLAVSNTSQDPYGTSTQSGTCTFNFFGANAPAAVTTAADVTPGTAYTTLASTIAPAFQGYIIADCQFQFAHGFAFITQIGTFLGTEGYLALVIPDPPRSPNPVSCPPGGAGCASGSGEQLAF
jgi:hypothetical protein